MNFAIIFEKRFLTFTLAVLGTVIFFALLVAFPSHYLIIGIPFILASLLSMVGLRDMLQTRHAVLRNYPILAHFRFFFEGIRPELRQYFLKATPTEPLLVGINAPLFISVRKKPWTNAPSAHSRMFITANMNGCSIR